MVDDDDNPEWDETNSRPPLGIEKLLASRAALMLTQRDFAALLGIPVATLQNWEQRRTEPDPIAMTLIDLIFDDPHGMRERLERRRAAAPETVVDEDRRRRQREAALRLAAMGGSDPNAWAPGRR
jgi:putative transcriptional regulator